MQAVGRYDLCMLVLADGLIISIRGLHFPYVEKVHTKLLMLISPNCGALTYIMATSYDVPSLIATRQVKFSARHTPGRDIVRRIHGLQMLTGAPGTSQSYTLSECANVCAFINEHMW